MAKRDYYETLEVNKSCDDKNLKSAFRKLAKKYHPDHNPGDSEAENKFKEISEAYDRLKDPESRAAYDRYGHSAFENNNTSTGGAGFDSNFSSSFSDIFNDFFGDAGSNSQNRQGNTGRGSDLRYNMEITLEDAFKGKSDTINVTMSASCNKCSGSGSQKGTSPIDCPQCHGSGKVRASQGFFTVERTCSSCQGQGRIIVNPCESCNGQGRTQKPKKLSVEIPAGIEDGNRIRLSGQGEAGIRGGSSGDLYIFVSLKSHSFFQRDGADIFCNIPVSMPTAALGGQIEIPTVDGGKTRVTIPEGSQNTKQFRLRGKGMPILRQKRFGDMYLQITVETPLNLSKKQKELLKEFENLSSKENNPESHGFFEKIKEFWGGVNKQ